MALRVRMALLLGLLVLTAQPGQSQSVMQSIFGNGPPPPLRPYYYPGMSPYRSPFGGPYSPNPPGWSADEGQRLDRAGTYRTLCVRLCDGFYFPISSASPGSSLARDADACNASCGAEARLFYHPNVGGDVDTMVDLTGMGYSALPNAFKYRKTLVQSCRCRPQPWSETERERHRAYAEGRPVVAEARPDQPGNAPVPLPGQDSTAPSGVAAMAPAADDPRIVPRPPPIARQIEPAQPSAGTGTSGPLKFKHVWPNDERHGR